MTFVLHIILALFVFCIVSIISIITLILIITSPAWAILIGCTNQFVFELFTYDIMGGSFPIPRVLICQFGCRFVLQIVASIIGILLHFVIAVLGVIGVHIYYVLNWLWDTIMLGIIMLFAKIPISDNLIVWKLKRISNV